jgi:hypothetical protein
MAPTQSALPPPFIQEKEIELGDEDIEVIGWSDELAVFGAAIPVPQGRIQLDLQGLRAEVALRVGFDTDGGEAWEEAPDPAHIDTPLFRLQMLLDSSSDRRAKLNLARRRGRLQPERRMRRLLAKCLLEPDVYNGPQLLPLLTRYFFRVLHADRLPLLEITIKGEGLVVRELTGDGEGKGRMTTMGCCEYMDLGHDQDFHMKLSWECNDVARWWSVTCINLLRQGRVAPHVPSETVPSTSESIGM